MLQVRLLGKVGVHALPYPFVTPADKALIHAVPVAVFSRQQAPLGSAAGVPQHPFDKSPALSFLPDIQLRAGPQEGQDL